jgi:hypothetical protein
VKIRLWGLPEENDLVVTALRTMFTVVDESEDYPPRRGTSPLRRRYVEVRLTQAPSEPGGAS